jgi:hypothetical protein
VFQRVSHGVINFLPADKTPAIFHPAFEQGNYFHGGQMRVQISGDIVKPVVNAFPPRAAGRRAFLPRMAAMAG